MPGGMAGCGVVAFRVIILNPGITDGTGAASDASPPPPTPAAHSSTTGRPGENLSTNIARRANLHPVRSFHPQNDRAGPGGGGVVFCGWPNRA